MSFASVVDSICTCFGTQQRILILYLTGLQLPLEPANIDVSIRKTVRSCITEGSHATTSILISGAVYFVNSAGCVTLPLLFSLI
jgi:hypothetical protein